MSTMMSNPFPKFIIVMLDCVSSPHPVLLRELAVMLVGYAIYANTFSHLVRYIYRQLPMWKRTHKVQGIFCHSGRDDAVLLTIMAIHHAAAGAMMLYGTVTGDATMFRRGYLLETAFEVHDYLAMAVPLYPYRSDNVKPELIVAGCFHHAPSIVSAYLVLETGLYENPHLQWVALSLLLGGAVSASLGTVAYFFDLETLSGTRIIAALTTLNAVFFLYCRFVVFPLEAMRLFQDVYQHPDLLDNNPWAMYILSFDAAVYTIFNVVILCDLIPTLRLWILRAIDGITPVSKGHVGSSRDSILKVHRRRRSSFMLDLATDPKRRASLYLAVNGFSVDIATHERVEFTTERVHARVSNEPLIQLTEEEEHRLINEDCHTESSKKIQ
jgi:hypothetical protein